MQKRVMSLFILMVMLAVVACAGKQKNILETNEPQVKLRSMQSRVFDIADQNLLLRIIIATFQDLGFVIDDAEESLGTFRLRFADDGIDTSEREPSNDRSKQFAI